MKVRLFLAHAAEVQAGMLFAMGMGWTEIGPAPSPFAIAALIEVTWGETNRPRTLSFDVVDLDGRPVNVPTPTGDRPFQIQANFDQGRPPGVAPGTSFMAPIAINVGSVQFEPGRQYVLRALVDGEVLDQTVFRTRAVPPPLALP